MPSRIDIGPEGGPFVAVNENNNDLELQDINGNVIAKWDETAGHWDFANNSLTNLAAIETDEASVEQVAAEISNSSGGSNLDVPDATFTKIPFDTTSVEDTTVLDADLTNNEIVVQTAGTYLIDGWALWNSDASWTTGDRAEFRAAINGSRYHQSRQLKTGTGTEGVRTMPTVKELSVGDSISLFAFQDSGGTRQVITSLGDDGGNLTVVRIG